MKFKSKGDDWLHRWAEGTNKIWMIHSVSTGRTPKVSPSIGFKKWESHHVSGKPTTRVKEFLPPYPSRANSR